MPRDRNVRERHWEAILEILSEREVVKEQADLVERLKEMGFVVTQSSISRDLPGLRELARPRYSPFCTASIISNWLTSPSLAAESVQQTICGPVILPTGSRRASS